jgi:hypothetical protein
MRYNSDYWIGNGVYNEPVEAISEEAMALPVESMRQLQVKQLWPQDAPAAV